MDQGRGRGGGGWVGHIKMNFKFRNQVSGKKMKVDEKIGVIPVESMFSSYVMFLELSKKFLAVLC